MGVWSLRPAVSPNRLPHLDARAASQRVGGGRAEERRPCGSRSLKDAGGGGGGEKRRGLHWLQGEEKRNSEDAKSEGTEEGGYTGLWNRKDAKKMAARQCGKEIVPAERVCCHSPRLCAAGGWVQSLPLCHFAQAPRTPAQGRSIDIGDVHGMPGAHQSGKAGLALVLPNSLSTHTQSLNAVPLPPPPLPSPLHPKKKKKSGGGGGGEVDRA